MSKENANKLVEQVNPIQWDTYKDCSQQYVNRYGYIYDQCTTLKPRIKLSELKQMAKDRGIKNYSSMKRVDLVISLGCSINDTSVRYNASE